MGLFKTILSLIFISTLCAENKNHILYLTHAREYEKAIYYYQKYFEKTQEHDFEILQKIALSILENGAKSTNTEERQLAIFGAGLAASTKSLKILEKGLFLPEMGSQLTALHFICALQDNETNNLLIKAMSSDFLETRIEAAFQMAQKKYPCALGQIESLMQKLPIFFKPFFPQLFGLINTNESLAILKNMLFDKDPNVCTQAILSFAQNNRDDLLYLLKKKMEHSSIAEKEALAFSISHLNDSSSMDILKNYTQSSNDYVKLASYLALYKLGDKTSQYPIIEMAKNNLFAINALGSVENSEEFLAKLTRSNDLQIRANSSIALLKKKDKRALEGIKEILIDDGKAIIPRSSLGRTLNFFQIVSTFKRKDIDFNLSLEIKQSLLKEAIELDLDSFISLANDIFKNNQNDLIPYLAISLSNLKSDKIIEFLQNYAKNGSPLIRNYCNLSLYKMDVKGFYFERLKKYIKENNSSNYIHLKPFEPNKIRYEKNQYELSPDESNKLLIDIFTIIAEKHEVDGIMVILDALKTTHKFNRYPLCGLLLRATE